MIEEVLLDPHSGAREEFCDSLVSCVMRKLERKINPEPMDRSFF